MCCVVRLLLLPVPPSFCCAWRTARVPVRLFAQRVVVCGQAEQEGLLSTGGCGRRGVDGLLSCLMGQSHVHLATLSCHPDSAFGATLAPCRSMQRAGTKQPHCSHAVDGTAGERGGQEGRREREANERHSALQEEHNTQQHSNAELSTEISAPPSFAGRLSAHCAQSSSGFARFHRLEQRAVTQGRREQRRGHQRVHSMRSARR